MAESAGVWLYTQGQSQWIKFHEQSIITTCIFKKKTKGNPQRVHRTTNLNVGGGGKYQKVPVQNLIY
jgi:hypothetical protein